MGAEDLSHKSQEQVKMLANEQMLNSDGFLLITVAKGAIGHVHDLIGLNETEGYGLLNYGELLCRIRAEDRVFRDTTVLPPKDNES